MENENQIMINSNLKIIKVENKTKLKNRKKLYFFLLSLMYFIYHGIIFFIFINTKELVEKVQNDQTKSNLHLQNKINILENRINKISAKLNEYILINKEFESHKKSEHNINNNKYISEVELSEISFEKFDENVLQQIKNQQMEFCNNEKKYIKIEYEKNYSMIYKIY